MKSFRSGMPLDRLADAPWHTHRPGTLAAGTTACLRQIDHGAPRRTARVPDTPPPPSHRVVEYAQRAGGLTRRASDARRSPGTISSWPTPAGRERLLHGFPRRRAGAGRRAALEKLHRRLRVDSGPSRPAEAAVRGAALPVATPGSAVQPFVDARTAVSLAQYRSLTAGGKIAQATAKRQSRRRVVAPTRGSPKLATLQLMDGSRGEARAPLRRQPRGLRSASEEPGTSFRRPTAGHTSTGLSRR
jgi:hypothetical protein